MVGFLSFFSSFTRTTIKIPLKFPAFTFNKPKGYSITASNTEANLAAFIMRGDHLNCAISEGGHKNFTHTAGGSLNLQNLTNFQSPPPGKKLHFPKHYLRFLVQRARNKIHTNRVSSHTG